MLPESKKYSTVCFRLMISSLIATTVILFSAGLQAEELSLTVSAGDYRIITENGEQRIEIDDFGYLTEPGKPMLPAKNFLIALPPGAKVRSASVRRLDSRQLNGTYKIIPSPPPLPLDDPSIYRESIEKVRQEYHLNNDETYSSNKAYPEIGGKLIMSGGLRKYAYASVSFYPFSYLPQSGKLIFYSAAEITIQYDLPIPGSSEEARVTESKWDTLADNRASNLFINYNQMSGQYLPLDNPTRDPLEVYDYLIITTEALYNSVAASDFIPWKQSLGYGVVTALITENRIVNLDGRDLAEQIRNFLRDNYIAWNTKYVLIVGNCETVPMRYCYPDPNNHVHLPGNPFEYGGEVPTDYYYADLSDLESDSWDYDGDGFCGEFIQDRPDFLAEVYVGRIPTSNPSDITYALNKLVAFEQDTGNWKRNALNVGTLLFFENQDYSGYPKVDGATCMAHLEDEIMSGWGISHYSERAGLEQSEYLWPAVSEAAFINDWRNNSYAVVNWAGHGSALGASRSVWAWDDGDGVTEYEEIAMPAFILNTSNLDDDYPSIVFAISCNVGFPEPNPYGRLGVELLTNPSIGASSGVISASRSAAAAALWPTVPGGAQSMCYEFNRFMIDGPEGPEKVGEALYNSKFYCNSNFAFDHFYEYLNMFDYNLYGDPALIVQGVATADIPTLSEWGMLLMGLLFLVAGTVAVVKRRNKECFLIRR